MRQHCFPRDRGSKPYSVGKSTKVVNLKHKGMKKNRLHSDLVCKLTKSNINFQKTKIIFLFIVCLFMQVRFVSVQAQNSQVRLKVGQTTVKQIMSEVEKQTDYLFVYSESEVNVDGVVTVKKEKQEITDLLNLLSAHGLSYSFSDNYITLHKKAAGKNGKESGRQVKVSGKVVDSSGEPVIGANVTVKGNPAQGTITNANGEFELVVHTGEVLQVSYIGFRNQEIRVNDGSALKVQMQEDTKLLNEVVVTALGIKREEKALGYAVQKVQGDKLATVKVVDVGTSLTGKIAGLNVQNSTEFNQAPTLLLRGETPLLVIDGVPYKNMSLRDVPADDIETVDVLKGATAAALYGERGGVGVIMITTKKSKEEGLHVSINSSTMFQAGYLKLPEVQSGYSSGEGGKYNHYDFVWGDKLDIGRTAEQWNPQTHQFEVMPLTSRGKNNFKNFLETGFITNNNVSISQKGKYGSVRASLTHVYNKGQYPNTKLNKITYSVSGDMKWNKFSLDGGISFNKRFFPQNYGTGYGKGGYLYNLLVWTGPDYDLREFKDYWVKKDEQQNWMYSGWYDNPYFVANEVLRSSDYSITNGYMNVGYEFTPWLQANLRSGIDVYSERKTWRNPKSANSGWDKNGYFEIERDGGLSMNHDLMLTANHKFGDFSVEGIAGGTLYYYQDDMLQSQTAGGLTIPGYYSLKASVNKATTSSNYKRKQVNSLYGRFSASWKSTLYLDVTARNDWSSTLPSETRSYFYPSLSGSAILSEFIHLPQWMSFWKVRGSWTQTKKDVDIYEINNVYSITTDAWDNLSAATYPTSIRGTLIRPTATRSWEVGTALNFLNNRLRVDFAYYNTLKYNLTRSATVSEASGFSGTMINYGEEQERRGVELTLTGDIIKTSDWEWSATFNWARDRYYYAKVDETYSEQRPWVAAGNRYDAFTLKDWERDPEGNIVHVNGLPKKSEYQSVVGYKSPDWIWGIINTIKYKAFTLNFSIDGRVGGVAYNMMEQALWNTGAHPDSDNQWRYEEVVNGKKTFIGKGVKVVSGTVEYDVDGNIVKDSRTFAPNDVPVSYETYIGRFYPNAYYPVYQTVQDQTFIKLRDLSITYEMPKSICDRFRLTGMQLGLVGQNLLIWTKDFKFSDPDQASENLNSPSIRYIGFNVKLNF